MATEPAPVVSNLPALRYGEMTPVTPTGAPPAEQAHGRLTPTSYRARAAASLGGWASALAFWLTPSLAYGVYIFFIAAPIYMSEAKFIVRSPAAPTSINLSTGSALNMSRSSDETQIVEAFMSSRDIVDQLKQTIQLEQLYARPEADLFSRFPRPFGADDVEHLRRRFETWAPTHVDESTGIATLTSYAFRAQDAQTIAAAMLDQAEALINKLNERAYHDRLAYAQSAQDEARKRVDEVEARLTQFRNDSGTVDIGREATAALEQIGKMSSEVALLETTLRQQIAVTPNSPAIASQKAQIDAYKREIDGLRRKIVGEQSSMTRDIAQYERLSLERMLAARGLEAAISNFDKVRQQAQVQQFYLARVSEPSLPQTAEYPRRLTWFAIVFVALFIAWRSGAALAHYIREHDV
jgi:BexC/CtrB/KpsE family polysaccharide export inner-membrane protein